MADFASEYAQSGEETGNDGEGSEEFDKEAFIEAVTAILIYVCLQR